MPVPFLAKLAAAAMVAAATPAALNGLLRSAPAAFDTVIVILDDGQKLEAGRDEVTIGLWAQCHAEGACGLEPKAAPAGADYPVTGVNAQDIAEFAEWINQAGGNWRLPTLEEQRQLVAGLPKEEAVKLFDDPRMAWAADYNTRKAYDRKVEPSGAFGVLPNGLRDIGGNVWEWTSTCVSADTGGFLCPAYFVGGEHEAEIPLFLRDAATGGCAAGVPPANLGFRLVRSR